MHYRLLHFLRCPGCGGTLSLHDALEREMNNVPSNAFNECGECAFRTSAHYPTNEPESACSRCTDVDVVSGELCCAECDARYAISNSIPRMVHAIAGESYDELRGVKEHTQKNFGFEWQFYARHGWDYGSDKVYDPGRFQIERENFFRKALVDPAEFADGVVIDAGCGNGRYSHQAARLGAEVIAMDLSDAVEAAVDNLRHLPSVHVVQGDIFRPPLRHGMSDRIFSLGVLMHTGDARRAFEALLSHLKPAGTISIHLYRSGNRIYEWVDALLRCRTVHMDLDRLVKHSARGARIAKLVYRTRHITRGRPLFYELMNCFVRLEMAEHNVFDWYSAPVASHHTYPEAHRWFRENDLEITADHNRRKPWIVRLLASPAGGVTVKGCRSAHTTSLQATET